MQAREAVNMQGSPG